MDLFEILYMLKFMIKSQMYHDLNKYKAEFFIFNLDDNNKNRY